jgi:hypothetical protein
MPLSRTRKIRAKRPRRAIDQSGQQMDGVSTISGASLVYAGYPVDPYA